MRGSEFEDALLNAIGVSTEKCVVHGVLMTRCGLCDDAAVEVANEVVARHKADLADLAEVCEIELPKPGSDTAKLLRTNFLLSLELERLMEVIKSARAVVDDGYGWPIPDFGDSRETIATVNYELLCDLRECLSRLDVGRRA
jgi:hypothetical protein